MRIDLRPRVPQHGAEAARVTQAEDSLGENQVNMIVFLRRCSGRNQTHAAGHAQMDDQPTALAGAAVGTAAVENQVLSSPLYGLDSFAGEAFRELGRQGVAQPGSAENGLNNGLPGR